MERLSTEEIDYYDIVDNTVLDDISLEMQMVLKPCKPEVRLIVTIPANNEERNIFETLEGLAAQKDMYGDKLNADLFEILVFCHNCTDRTEEECRRFLKVYPTVNMIVLSSSNRSINNVGAVRRVLMNIANSRIPVSYGLIIMTDADSKAHPLWLANLCGYLNSGYALICGRIDYDLYKVPESLRRALALRARYSAARTRLEDTMVPLAWDPKPLHAHNSGPNMAVRADIYRQIGGIRPIGFCEDVAFYDTIIWNDHKVRHCPMTIVTTSLRTETRVPWGFGAELKSVAENLSGLKVEGLESLLLRFSINGMIRDHYLYGTPDLLYSISRLSSIDEVRLTQSFTRYRTWKAAIHEMEKHLDNDEQWGRRFPLVPIDSVCRQIEDYLTLLEPTLDQTWSL